MFQSSSLAFYADTDFQNFRRHWCSAAPDNFLVFERFSISPFWIKGDNTLSVAANVNIYNADTGDYYPITLTYSTLSSTSTATGIKYKFSNTTTIPNAQNVVLYDSNSNPQSSIFDLYTWLSNGRFYLEIEVNGLGMYSETFTFQQVSNVSVTSGCGFCAIEWTSNKDIGDIIYSKGTMSSILYVAADEGSPEYVIEEEEEKDSILDAYKTFQKASKRCELEFIANESMCDAISLIPLHPNVTVTNQYGEANPVTDVAVDIKWETPCMARVKLTYAIAKHVRKYC